jgi:hypothetical protein
MTVTDVSNFERVGKPHLSNGSAMQFLHPAFGHKRDLELFHVALWESSCPRLSWGG